MPKYNKKRVEHICSLIKKDSYTVSELCSLSGISESTYYKWKARNLQFLQSITRAREEFDQMMVAEAKRSMVKKLAGYTVKETRTIYVDSGKFGDDGKAIPKVKEQIVTDKYFPPETPMIIFVLCNSEPEIWKMYRQIELTGKDGKDIYKEAKDFWRKLSDEDLDKKVKEIEQKSIDQSSVSAAK